MTYRSQKKASILIPIAIGCVLTFAGMVSLHAQSSPNIPVMNADQCQRNNGKWNSSTRGIPGDGNPHNFSVHAPNGSAEFMGGFARGFRQGLDEDYSFNCMINPQQPASIQNSEQRRCDPPGNDMSVERCTATSGSSGTLLCDYVNSTNAPAKMLELGGCWK